MTAVSGGSAANVVRTERTVIEELENEGLECGICAGIPEEPAKILLVGTRNQSTGGIDRPSHCTSFVVCKHALFLTAISGRTNATECPGCRGRIAKVETDESLTERMRQIIGSVELSDDTYCGQRFQEGTSISDDSWTYVHRIFGRDAASVAVGAGVPESEIPERVRSGEPPREEVEGEDLGEEDDDGVQLARELLGRIRTVMVGLSDSDLDDLAQQIGPLFSVVNCCWPQIRGCLEGCTSGRITSCILGVLGAIAGTVALIFAGIIGGIITVVGCFRR